MASEDFNRHDLVEDNEGDKGTVLWTLDDGRVGVQMDSGHKGAVVPPHKLTNLSAIVRELDAENPLRRVSALEASLYAKIDAYQDAITAAIEALNDVATPENVTRVRRGLEEVKTAMRKVHVA
jgi:hypothetical protein